MRRVLSICLCNRSFVSPDLTPAHARLFGPHVSGTETSNATCSGTSPCQTLQAAATPQKLAAQSCAWMTLTGTVTITKSITIDCNGTASTAMQTRGFPESRSTDREFQ